MVQEHSRHLLRGINKFQARDLFQWKVLGNTSCCDEFIFQWQDVEFQLLSVYLTEEYSAYLE